MAARKKWSTTLDSTPWHRQNHPSRTAAYRYTRILAQQKADGLLRAGTSRITVWVDEGNGQWQRYETLNLAELENRP